MSKVLVGLEALNFVKKYIKTADSKEFATKKQVLGYCKKFPLILKLSSEKILHKTETGGVVKVVNKEHLLKVLKDFDKIKNKFKIPKCKYFVQEYMPGIELLLGLKKDKSFGHVIVFGIGGVFVELIQDVQFRVCPINRKNAEAMITSLKNKKILEGFRCLPKANKKILIDSILSLSKLAKDKPEITELDINPLICADRTCKAVDVRIVFE